MYIPCQYAIFARLWIGKVQRIARQSANGLR